MLIKACLNGSRAPEEHPALPVTPDELAEAAVAAVAAGAGALHIHPRGANGAQMLAAGDQSAALLAIRAHLPVIPLGVSTAAWIEPDVERRLAAISSWRDAPSLPNFASVNVGEEGDEAVCEALLALGIGVEAGLATPADAQRLLASGLASHCLRILIEPDEEDATAALHAAWQIIAALDAGGIDQPRLLHGAAEATWPVLDLALQLDYATRIGLEDTLALPDGRRARDNAELVAEAVRRAQASARIA